jgi:hypothetical protein
MLQLCDETIASICTTDYYSARLGRVLQVYDMTTRRLGMLK